MSGGRGTGPPRGRGSGFSSGRGAAPRGGSGFGRSGPPPDFSPATIDSRLSSTNLNDLVSKFASPSVVAGGKQGVILPPRPGFGKAGKVVVLRTNHFPVNAFPSLLYEYSVQVTPPPKAAGMIRRVFDLLEESPVFSEYAKYTASDRSSKIISAKELPIPENGTLDFVIKYYDEDEDKPSANAPTHVLSLSFTTTHDTSNLNQYLQADPSLRNYETAPIISAFQLILGKYSLANGAVRIGKTEGIGSKSRYFFPAFKASQTRLDDFLVAFRGFSLSVRPTWRQLSVNINVATTAFYDEGPLAQALSKLGASGRASSASSFFRNVKVKLLHLGHKKKIARITNILPSNHSFSYQPTPTTPARQITVAEYFQRQYNNNRPLRFPNLPLVEFGTSQRTIYIPPEFCHILPNQPFRGTLTGEQTRNMVNAAVLNPGEHQSEIMQRGLASLGLSPLAEVLRSFGIQVGPNMVTLPGRQLASPSVEYRGKKNLTINDGAWNLVGSKFYLGAAMTTVGVLLLSDGPNENYKNAADPELTAALASFASVCSKYGIDTSKLAWKPALVQLKRIHEDPNRELAMQNLTKMFATGFRPPIILAIMSREDRLYDHLKRFLDVEKDIHSVCSLYTNFRNCKDQYFANLALKFNAKLGGVNHIPSGISVEKLRTQGAMLVGADVTHPGSSSIQGTPSIVAVVATVDSTLARFPVSIRLQESGTEMIADLEEMMIERLKAYELKNRALPKAIVFVRDGVSEGQFQTVADVELPQIRNACTRVSPKTAYQPPITLIVAGKRHQNRFYATKEEESDTRNNNNTKAGTVVDQGITSVYNYDFFLQAHSALKGTARPTHYTFIVDDKGYSADEIQNLLHSISIVARATRSVGLASPAYYADLACEHARCYIQNLYTASEASSAGGRGYSKEEQAARVFEQARKLWGVGPTGQIMKNSMFYL